MRRKLRITMTPRESAAEAFARFLLTKRAGGVKPRPLKPILSIFTRFPSIWTPHRESKN